MKIEVKKQEKLNLFIIITYNDPIGDNRAVKK